MPVSPCTREDALFAYANPDALTLEQECAYFAYLDTLDLFETRDFFADADLHAYLNEVRG